MYLKSILHLKVKNVWKLNKEGRCHSRLLQQERHTELNPVETKSRRIFKLWSL